MIYRRGKKRTCWMRFRFASRMIHESTKTANKTIAKDAERERRRKLELSVNGLKERPSLAPTFKIAAKRWQGNREHTMAAKTHEIAATSLKRLLPVFGDKLLSEIEPQHIVDYQQARLGAGVCGRTVNIELGALRQVLGKKRWLALGEDENIKFKTLPENKDIGRAITKDQEDALLEAASKPRYKDLALYSIVVTALNTGMRSKEIKTLRWSQVDLIQRSLTVGKTKTAAGSHRVIQLNQSAVAVLAKWSSRTPEASPSHFVFPACENHRVDPNRPITSFRTAWRKATKAAGLPGLRFHDLRHTAVTKLLENGTPFAVVAEIMGWSAGMTVRMSKHYAHIRPEAQRTALDGIATEFQVPVHQNVHQVEAEKKDDVPNLLM
jgi:integrase